MTKLDFYDGFQAVLTAAKIENFTARGDFAVNGARMAPPAVLWANMIGTVKIAQDARDHFGVPLTVSSHYRDREYNKKVGGSINSRHLYFNALDIMAPIDMVSPRTLYEFFVSHPKAPIMGIGLYPTFVHIDTRGYRSRF